MGICGADGPEAAEIIDHRVGLPGPGSRAHPSVLSLSTNQRGPAPTGLPPAGPLTLLPPRAG